MIATALACVALMAVLALAVTYGLLARRVRALTAEVALLRAAGSARDPDGAAAPARLGSPIQQTEGVVPADHRDPVFTPTPMPPAEPDLDDRPRVESVSPAPPLRKAIAFGYGVRRALGEEGRSRVAVAFRRELRRQRRQRRRRSVSSRGMGWQP